MAGERLPFVVRRKLLRIFALLLLGWLGEHPLFGQQMGDFSFQIQPDGTPLFTQVLRWNAVQNVLYYKVTLQTSAGKEISTSKLTKPVLRLNLSPGDYRYRIVLYNLLGKPGLVLPWVNFTVRKAEIPRVTAVSQNLWFLDNLKPVITLSGEELVPGAKIVLKPASASARTVAGTVIDHQGSSTLHVEFPQKGLVTGTYTLVLTNPSGLSFTLPSAVTIRYQRTFDFLISAGYDPWVALSDSWYTHVWPGTFFPSGAAGRFSVYFLKRPFGYFGAQLEFWGQQMVGGTSAATVDSSSAAVGVSAIYKYPFSRIVAATGEVGGGVVLDRYAFHYGSQAGSEMSSGDPYVTVGFSVQRFFTHWLYLELGSNWVHVFMDGFSVGGLTPFVMSGVLF